MKRKQCLPKGYKYDSSVKPLLKELHTTNLCISIATVLFCWLLLLSSATVGQILKHAFGFNWQWLLLHGFIIWPCCSVALRGLENLTQHEASHYNLYRKDQTRNDCLANWGGALWVVVTVEQYRKTHFPHHFNFATALDTCWERYERLGLDQLDRTKRARYIVNMVCLLPTYYRDYWSQFKGNLSSIDRSILLHALLVAIGLYLYSYFWLVWCLYFAVPFLVYLPIHRFLAEAEKHRYQDAESIFDATCSHLGLFQRFILHPFGDAYHLLHHMDPKIPFWKVRRAHELLMAHDSAYRTGKFRKSIFEEPGSGE